MWTRETESHSGLRRRCPTLGVLYGWQVYGGDLDVYLGSLVTCLTAAARREGVNLLTTVAVGSSARNAAPAWPSLGTNRIFSPVGPWNTDGLIVINPLPAEETLEDVQRLQESGHPVVYLSSGPYGPLQARGGRPIGSLAGQLAAQDGDARDAIDREPDRRLAA